MYSTSVHALGVGLLAFATLNALTAQAGSPRPEKLIAGDSAELSSGVVSTWARVNGAGNVIWVGATIPLSVIENPPAEGDGPSGAIAVLEFPSVVQDTTYFNHFELHWEAHGHPTNPGYLTPDRYSEPHFDFHFYGIPVEEVAAIPFALPPLPDASAELLPVGYEQPEISVPQMGRHAAPFSEFTAVGPLDAAMLIGFLPDASYMHFIEPMIGRAYLLERRTFSLPIPQPASLGRETLYPSSCLFQYDRQADAYNVIFRGFETME